MNGDPKILDSAYVRMLGPGGDKVLGEEVKWLAVTHKSYDHGKRGFNDRLAYLGMSWTRSRQANKVANGTSRAKDSGAPDKSSAHQLTTRKSMA